MSEYEYEKVEGMTVGQVVDKMDGGSDFYYPKNQGMQVLNRNLQDIEYVIKNKQLHTRKEKPWWEGCEGGLVMARDFNESSWRFKVFAQYREGVKYKFIDVEGKSWKQMRPLTSAERDAIKVEG